MLSTPGNLPVRHFWSSRNKSKPLSPVEMCFEKMLWVISEMVNTRAFKPLPLCSCMPENLMVEYFWSSRNKRKPLSQVEMCFEKMLWGISEMVNARACKPLPLCSSTPGNLPVRHFWSSRNKSKPLSQLEHVFWENAVGYLRNGEWLELSNLYHCLMHPWKLINRHYWSSRDTRKPLSQLKHVFWENAVGYLRNGER